MGTKLKILTLNCWGVFTPLACELRHERMTHIAEELSKAEHDIVLLEEIWTQSDYEKLCSKMLDVYPHTHYFHSGLFGSGVCVFSKYMIVETAQHSFVLNGHAHKFYHGDWFGGKLVGLAKIQVKDIKVNVYGTHLHAQYNEAHDEYLAHRVAQAFEMSQFIKMTSETCDLVIVGGDFNLQPKDLGCKIIRFNANLLDSWIDQKDKSGHVMTCDRPDNSFTTKSALEVYPDGICLDYLMYRSNAGYNVDCEKCYLTMRKVPGQTYNYSDHEGVAAEFIIHKNLTAMAPPRETKEIEIHLSEALPLMERGSKKVKADVVFYGVALLLCIVALVFTADLHLPFGMNYLMIPCRTVMTLCVGFYLWMSIVMANREINGITATRKDINNLLKSNNV